MARRLHAHRIPPTWFDASHSRKGATTVRDAVMMNVQVQVPDLPGRQLPIWVESVSQVSAGPSYTLPPMGVVKTLTLSP
jgi:hypothetical protein